MAPSFASTPASGAADSESARLLRELEAAEAYDLREVGRIEPTTEQVGDPLGAAGDADEHRHLGTRPPGERPEPPYPLEVKS